MRDGGVGDIAEIVPVGLVHELGLVLRGAAERGRRLLISSLIQISTGDEYY